MRNQVWKLLNNRNFMALLNFVDRRNLSKYNLGGFFYKCKIQVKTINSQEKRLKILIYIKKITKIFLKQNYKN